MRAIGTAYSYFFPILAGVRQGGLLSPALFAIYMDVLVCRLRVCGYGCKLLNYFFRLFMPMALFSLLILLVLCV